MTNLNDLIASLTIEHAREYAAETDKLVWIEYALLDPINIPRRYAEQVEAALLALLGR
jgi:adenine C2-methylase RlmN of 23S rRNA A2503 and tRNA A37